MASLYRFFVVVDGTDVEINAHADNLSFSYQKINEKVCADFNTTLGTAIVFSDDANNANTPTFIYKAFSFFKNKLNSSVQKVRLKVRRKGGTSTFFDGYVNLFSTEQDVWDFDQNKFSPKVTQDTVYSDIENAGDQDFNIQEIATKRTATDSLGTTYTNGMSFLEVFTFLLSESGLELAAASDFMPAMDKIGLTDLVIYDKSDIKRPGSSQQATITEVSLNSMLTLFSNLFNVKYSISGNVISLVHFSDETMQEVDISSKIAGVRNNKFSFVSIPKTETWKAEESKNDEFNELRVEYVFDGKDKAEYRASGVCVDLGFAIDNRVRLAADSDAKDEISDSGIFIVGVDSLGDIVNSASLLNGNLSYDYMFPFLWAEDRYLRTYKKNGVTTSIDTDRRIKAMSFDLEYYANFKPDVYFSTKYGVGILEKAELVNSKLKLNLLL